MLALRKTVAAAGVALQDVSAPPSPPPGEVLVQVTAAGICGTDLHIDDWAEGFHFMADRLPVTLGHEFCGRISEVGEGVQGLEVGQRVVVQPVRGCGTCADCSSGAEHDCLGRVALGIHRPGGFAPYVCAPAASCLPVPDHVPDELAALVEPLTTGVQAVALAEIAAGDRVVVFGPGPIGQGTAAIARRKGAVVTVVGHGDAPRFQTLRAMGFDRLIDLAEEGGEQALRAVAGAGFDVALDASGAPSVINLGLSVLKPYGVFVIAGMPDRPASFDVMLLVRGRQQLRGCSRAPDWTWREALKAVSDAPDAFAPMVTHRLPLSRAEEGFALARSKAASKVLLHPDA